MPTSPEKIEDVSAAAEPLTPEHFHVPATALVQLARRRGIASVAAAPVGLALGAAALTVSLSLALIAVLGAFAAYACLSVARHQRRQARTAADLDFELSGDELDLPGEAPRSVLRGIERPEYVRLISLDSRVVDFWLDAGHRGDAFVDLPLSPADRDRLRLTLEKSGVSIRREGSLQSVVFLMLGLVFALSAWVLALTFVGLSAVSLLADPWTNLAVALGVGACGALGVRRRSSSR